MKHLLNGLFIAASATVLAVGVVVALETLLSKRPKRNHPIPEPAPKPPPEPVKQKPERNFSIKRTKSEVGFVYWILEGYGRYKCFILCDSWNEAIAEAKVKMAEVDDAEFSESSPMAVVA